MVRRARYKGAIIADACVYALCMRVQYSCKGVLCLRRARYKGAIADASVYVLCIGECNDSSRWWRAVGDDSPQTRIWPSHKRTLQSSRMLMPHKHPFVCQVRVVAETGLMRNLRFCFGLVVYNVCYDRVFIFWFVNMAGFYNCGFLYCVILKRACVGVSGL